MTPVPPAVGWNCGQEAPIGRSSGQKFTAGTGHVVRRGPLSPAQRSIWLLEQTGVRGVYHNLLVVTLRGPLHRAALQDALHAVVARHEALRTRFPSVRREPNQEVMAQPSVVIEDLSAAGPPGALSLSVALDRAGAWARQPFALETVPPVRVSLTPVEESGHLLVIVAHHLVSDGDSMTIVLDELLTGYEAQVAGAAGPLAEPAAQFIDVMAGLAPRASGRDAGLAYWQEHLAGAPGVLDLPLDRLRPARRSYRGAVSGHTFRPATVAAVRNLAREQRVSVFMVVAAMLAVLLTRLAGQDEVVLGIPVSLRRDASSHRAVGYLVNTVAVRIPVRPGQAVADLLTDVRRIMLRAYDRSHVPFDEVVRAVNPPRRADHNPVFQALLAFTDRGDGTAVRAGRGTAGLTLEFPAVEPGTARTDVSFCVHEVAGSLAVDVEYATDLCEPATAAALACALESLLAAAAADPAQPAARLPLAGHTAPGQRPAAATRRSAPDPLRALLDRVAAVAAEAPRRVLLECPDCAVTAGALAAAAGGDPESGAAGSVSLEATSGCQGIISALRVLRAAGPSAGQSALGCASGQASRAALAAAAGWLLSPASPLHTAGQCSSGQNSTLRLAITGPPVSATVFALVLAQLSAGRPVVFAGPDWAGALRRDQPTLVAGPATGLLAGWPRPGPAPWWPGLAGLILLGEPPLTAPWQRLAQAAGGCPVSYLGGPVAAAGLAFCGALTSQAPAGRLLGHPVSGVTVTVENPWGVPGPPALPGILAVRAAGTRQVVPLCVASFGTDGAAEMLGPLPGGGQPRFNPTAAPPARLEAAIAEHPGAGDVLVSWPGDGSRGGLPVADVMPEPGARLAAGEIMDGLRNRVARHLLPGELRIRPRLVTTPDGWLDRFQASRGTVRRNIGSLLVEALGAADDQYV